MNNSLLNLDDVLKSTGGVQKVAKGDFAFTSVVTDSRNVVAGSLFVPLRGQNQDGHQFCKSAIDNGANVLLVDEAGFNEHVAPLSLETACEHSIAVIVVQNTLKALQDIATAYVAKFPLLVKVAITGSSGKTTTKQIIASILSQKYNVVCNEGNLNSETGLPLSVFKITSNNQIGVFEMGMNRKNEIKEISAVLKANFALITNIGTAHIGILGTQEDIVHEKRHVFDFVSDNGAAFINSMDEYANELAKGVKGQVIHFGNFVPESVSGVKFVRDCGMEGTEFLLDGVLVHLRLSGVYNYVNCLGAIAVAKRFGIPTELIKNGIECVNPIDNRMQSEKVMLRNGRHVTLIKDCYNANPESMKGVLDFCKTLGTRSIYVLGDMLELGDKSSEAHTSVGAIVSSDRPHFCVFTGTEMQMAYDKAFSRGYTDAMYIENPDNIGMQKIADVLLQKSEEGDVILLKASRGLALERVIPLIIERRHSDGHRG